MDYDSVLENVNPNYMQIKALKELNRCWLMCIRKALIVATAGDGGIIVSSQAKTS